MDTTTVSPLLRDAPDFLFWSWSDLEPYYKDLEAFPLSESSVDRFLRDWTFVAERVDEIQRRLWASTTCDTADNDVERRYHAFLNEVFPWAQQSDQRLKQKLLQSGLQPEGMKAPLRKIRADAEIFRKDNQPLETEEKRLDEEYFKITGAQMVNWEGKEIPIAQLQSVYYEPDRELREKAWRAGLERRLADVEAIDEVWRKMVAVRLKIASNAGFGDYRSFKWKQLKRFDYTPEDAKSFDKAIEEVVVPATARLMEKRRDRLGIPTVRPWDIYVDPLSRPALLPFTDVASMVEGSSKLFNRLDPQLGQYFDTMRERGHLDLDSRKNKAPGAYSYPMYASRSAFIFDNFIGSSLDVEVILHESGHAFHYFERSNLPYYHQQSGLSSEVTEVASMAMEYLPEPYFLKGEGGFYTPAQASQAALTHLESRVLYLWCHIGMLDVFQHWIYENVDLSQDPENCHQIWSNLYDRFMPFIDWSGLDDDRRTGWQGILHPFTVPFYVIEYGLAQLAAVQIWANSRRDQKRALQQYRHMLSLGETRSIPQLYEAAGAKFAFDAGTLRDSVQFIERAMGGWELEG
jgi:oligoendopeptidase F